MRVILVAAASLLVVDGATLTSAYVEANGDILWKNFKSQFGKVYDNGEEELRKKKVYLANMRKSAELKAGNPHAEYGENVYSDLDEVEFAGMRGTRLSTGGGERIPIILDGSVYVPKVGNATARCHDIDSINLNWVNAGVVTHVKSQGSCASCWAFSSTGSIEAQWAIAGHDLVSLSEQELVSCAPSPNAGCFGGFQQDAFDWLIQKKNGEIKTESSYPYTEEHWDNGPVTKCDTNVDDKPTGAVISEVLSFDNNEIQMYAALARYGPLAISVDATSWQGYTSGIVTDCISNRIDHGVLLVGHGYDANKNLEYWVVKNSWGSAWGESGYIRLAFGSDQCLITSHPLIALVASPPPVPGVVPDPDAPGLTVPGILTPPPPDPFIAVPQNPDIDATCISGPECNCPTVLFLSGKAAGSEICVAAIVIPIILGLFCMLLGALVITYVTPRTGLTEAEVRKMLKEYKQRQREQEAVYVAN